jgi:hypothetical protein
VENRKYRFSWELLGDSDFVEKTLKADRETLEEKYTLKAMGCNFNRITHKSIGCPYYTSKNQENRS